MSENEIPKQPPQAEIEQPKPATPEDVGAEMPEMHPVHKTKMTLLIVVTILLGAVSIVSLILVLKVKGNDGAIFRFAQNEPASSQKDVKETTPSVKKPEKKSSEDFNPAEIVKELDELGLEEIEKEYLDSGLN